MCVPARSGVLTCVQIYKQQQSNMIIDDAEEPRYFEGVQVGGPSCHLPSLLLQLLLLLPPGSPEHAVLTSVHMREQGVGVIKAPSGQHPCTLPYCCSSPSYISCAAQAALSAC